MARFINCVFDLSVECSTTDWQWRVVVTCDVCCCSVLVLTSQTASLEQTSTSAEVRELLQKG